MMSALTVSALLGRVSKMFMSVFPEIFDHSPRRTFVHTDVGHEAWLADSPLIYPKGVLLC